MPKKISPKKYIKKIDKKDPLHGAGIVILFIAAAWVAMMVLKALVFVVLIGGLIYILYLASRKGRK